MFRASPESHATLTQNNNNNTTAATTATAPATATTNNIARRSDRVGTRGRPPACWRGGNSGHDNTP
eukprot:3035862-Lingulodinium_polyedra.AAC.1